MKRSSNPKRIALTLMAVVAVAGIFGLAHATLGLYQTPGTQYRGSWIWNDAATDTAEVDVRVQALCPTRNTSTPTTGNCVRNLRVEVTGVAADGSQETKTALVQVPLGFIRQVTVEFDHQLTSLLFVKILPVGPSSSCAPF